MKELMSHRKEGLPMLHSDMTSDIISLKVQTRNKVSPVSQELVFEGIETLLKEISTALAVNYSDISGYAQGANPIAPRKREQYLPYLMGRVEAMQHSVSSTLKAVRYLKGKSVEGKDR